MRRLKQSIGRFVARVFSRWAAAADRARIADLERMLGDTEVALRAAQAENRLVAEIHETDIARRRRERAIFDRDRAQAQVAENAATQLADGIEA